MEFPSNSPNDQPSRRARAHGCLLGGAVGDALGAPIEFMDLQEIRARYGPAGVTHFETAYGRKGAITDDTQMSLFTAEGLILSAVRPDYATTPITAIYHAYLRWLYTQDDRHQGQLVNTHGTCAVIDGILTGHGALFSRRAPGRSCLGALRSGQMGSMDRPINHSKGCGGLMRVAPIGLANTDAQKAFELGMASAAITHGHPSAFLCAGFMAALISGLAAGSDLMAAVDDATRLLIGQNHHGECITAIDAAIAWSQRPSVAPEDVEALGAGWVAEEALAIGLFSALVAGRDFSQGVLLAVNHSGDSDSTGSIAGSIIGAQHGTRVIPAAWLAGLEMRNLIQEMADDLFDRFD